MPPQYGAAMKQHRTHAQRRRCLGASLAALSLLGSLFGLADAANAQNWPDRPIKLLVPFAAGGNIDVTGRLMAARLSETLGQQVVVENRVGGGGIIAMEAVQRAAPDGYTLLWASTNVMAIVPATTKVKYDPVKDFAPISQLGSSPQVLLVNSKVPAKTVAEFVAYAKAQPQPLAYGGGGGPGSASNLIMALFLHRADLKMTSVSYRGTAPALTDVIGGQAQFLVVDLASARPHLQSGKLRALAVTTSRRTALAPDLPTIEETLRLRDFDLAAWTGLFGPAGLPREVVDKLSATLQQIMAKPAVIERLTAAGAEPTPSDAATFAELVKRQLELWGRKVKDAGILPE